MTVMASSGYGGATIPLIAQAAGLTTGLVHYHFDSKQAILIELIKHLTALVEVRGQSESLDAVERLVAFIDAHLAYGKGANANAVACWISIGAEAVNQPAIRLAYQEATGKQLANLESICLEVLRRERREEKNRREIALGILAAIEGSYRLLVSAPELVSKGFAAPTVRAMALGLIAAQPSKKHKG